MRKGIKLYGLLNHKKCFYGGSLFLLLLFITSCKSNQFLIDSNEVENVNFWFIGDVDTDVPITDCLHIINSTVKPIFSYFNTHYLNIGIKTEN